MRRLFILFVFALSASFISFANKASDSLSGLAQKENNLKKKADLLLTLCSLYRTYPTDSLFSYSHRAIEASEKYGDTYLLTKSHLYLGVYYYKTSQLDSVKNMILYIRQQISTPKNVSEKQLLNKADILLGGVNIKENKQKEALAVYYDVLTRAGDIKDSSSYLWALNGIGWAYMELGRYNDAIYWFHKGIAIPVSDLYEPYKTNMYNNIASCYGSVNKINIAKHYAIQGVALSEKHQDLFCIANGLNILGNVYILENNTGKAIECISRATAIRKTSGDPFFIVSDMSQLSLLYASDKNFEEAIQLSDEAIRIAEEKSIDAKLPFLYNTLSEIYSQKGDYKNAYLTQLKLNNIKDKRYQTASAEKLAELQVKYETSIKENTIQKQRFELSKKNYMLYGSVGLFLLIAAIGFIAYRSSIQKEALKLQTVLARQREDNARAILEVEEKERSRFAAELHDGLGPMLSAVKYNLSELSDKEEFFSDEEKISFQKAMNILDESCREVRQVSHDIMPQTLLKKGLSNAIRDFVSKIENKNLQVHLYLSGLDEDMDPKVKIAAYRIIQESVNNVIKHADATQLDISLTKDEDGLTGAIEDNGKGFNVKEVQNNGIGLSNIISRIQFLHGHVDIDSRTGNGTLIAFHIP